MTKQAIMDTEVQDLVQLVSKESVIEEFGEAVECISQQLEG